jgi:hypothetical protein
MTTRDNQTSADPEPDRELLERHGIAVVRADQYHVGRYRYTNLADAIAQAVRRATSSGSDG